MTSESSYMNIITLEGRIDEAKNRQTMNEAMYKFKTIQNLITYAAREAEVILKFSQINNIFYTFLRLLVLTNY